MFTQTSSFAKDQSQAMPYAFIRIKKIEMNCCIRGVNVTCAVVRALCIPLHAKPCCRPSIWPAAVNDTSDFAVVRDMIRLSIYR